MACDVSPVAMFFSGSAGSIYQIYHQIWEEGVCLGRGRGVLEGWKQTFSVWLHKDTRWMAAEKVWGLWQGWHEKRIKINHPGWMPDLRHCLFCVKPNPRNAFANAPLSTRCMISSDCHPSRDQAPLRLCQQGEVTSTMFAATSRRKEAQQR